MDLQLLIRCMPDEVPIDDVQLSAVCNLWWRHLSARGSSWTNACWNCRRRAWKNTGNADIVQDGWVDVSTFCRYVVVMTTILYVSGSIWYFTRNQVILTKFSIGPISSSKSQILIIFILWLLLWVCGRCKRKNHSRSTLLNWIAISNSGNLPDWGSWKCPASLSVWSGVVKNMKYQSLLRQTRWKH